MRLKFSKRSPSTDAKPFGILVDDVLRLILERVQPSTDLRNLCLVSRELYLFTVPLLYWKLHLDL